MGRRSAISLGATLAAIAFATVLITASPLPARALMNCDTNGAGLSGPEQEMFNLINAARAEEGLTPLILSPALTRSSAWKSEDRSAWGTTPSDPLFSHQDSLGRMPSPRANDCGFPAEAAENIAYGWGGAKATFDAWMSSPGHRANILMSYYVTVGIGEYNDRWTADFGIYNDGAPAPTPVRGGSTGAIEASSATATSATTFGSGAHAWDDACRLRRSGRLEHGCVREPREQPGVRLFVGRSEPSVAPLRAGGSAVRELACLGGTGT